MTEPPSSTMSAYEKYQELNVKQVAKLIGVESSFSVWDYVKRGFYPNRATSAPMPRVGAWVKLSITRTA